MVQTRSGVAYTQSISTPGVTVVTSPSATGQGTHKRWRYAEPPRTVVSPSATGEGTHTRFVSAEPGSPTPTRTKALSRSSMASNQQLSTLSDFDEYTVSGSFSGESHRSDGSFLDGPLSTLACSGSISGNPDETPFDRWLKRNPTGRYIVGADTISDEAEAQRNESSNGENRETPQSRYARLLAEKKRLYAIIDAMPPAPPMPEIDDRLTVVESTPEPDEPDVEDPRATALGPCDTEIIEDHSAIAQFKRPSLGPYPAHLADPFGREDTEPI